MNCDKETEDLTREEPTLYKCFSNTVVEINAKRHYCSICNREIYDYVNEEDNKKEAIMVFLEHNSVPNSCIARI